MIRHVARRMLLTISIGCAMIGVWLVATTFSPTPTPTHNPGQAPVVTTPGTQHDPSTDPQPTPEECATCVDI